MNETKEEISTPRIKPFGLTAVLFGVLGLLAIIFQSEIMSFGGFDEANMLLAARIIGAIALISSLFGWIQKEPKRPIYVGMILSILTLFWLYFLYAIVGIVVLFLLFTALLS